MRFAIKTRPEHQTWAQIRDVWVAADEVELFESAWNWDHFYPLSAPFTGPNLEAWTMLAALAQATSRIRLNLRHVPEEERPPQEPLEIDYDPWTQGEGPRRRS